VNKWVVSRLVGVVVFGIGLAMLIPGIVALHDDNHDSVVAFGTSAGITLVLAFVLYRLGAHAKDQLIGPREAIGVVGIGWILAGVFGALPLLLDGAVHHPIDAIFESVSGFTTTGATVITDLSLVSRSSLLWRSMTHWLGGMGIIVLFVAIFPQLGVGARRLLSNEVPGPITERLRPRLKQTALRLWWIYTIITAVLAVLLLIAGMDWFDAVNHALATLATGGYSTQDASIGAYNSVSIDVIITVFMLLAGINFGLYHLILQGRGRAVFKDRELRAYLLIYFVVTVVIAYCILDRHGDNPFQALRHAAFQTAAVQTTTGFGTDDFNSYPALPKIMLFLLMFVGGCAGSTAGGMKVGRILVLIKAAFRELRQSLRPQEVRALRIGEQVVPEQTLRSIAGFVILFLVTYIVAVLALAGMGLDAETAGSAAAASLGNIGPGFGLVGPTSNYAMLSYEVKSTLTICMLLGRLELIAMFSLILPGLWRKR
jgi:trk system potassium uptake protein TrkH